VEERRDDAARNLDSFGLQVRLLRTARGLSQERLAHEAGVHRAVVGFIERGERDIGISQLWPLAAALGVEVADLFPRTVQTPGPTAD
jgi:transcriptional regulator with XRE-family HTH domain